MLKTVNKRIDYAKISTETVNPRSKKLDALSALGIVELMNREDRQVLQAVSQARLNIASAVNLIVRSLGFGGRLFLVGAGTSGRLGVIEAAECPPTFNTSPNLVQAIMAGGRSAVFRSKEGAEDSESAAAAAVRRAVRKGDVVVGIAASGVTPFVRSALQTARQRKARTILVTCNKHSVNAAADIRILLNTGPEVLTGSTRLKAGSACKMTLNILTTACMVRLGKVYRNYMVDLQPKSKKLVARGIRFLKLLGRVSDARAKRLFQEARGQVKVGILMSRGHLTRPQALQRLAKTKGFLGKALSES
ncbi:MAG: N-acetylmuramic acid 6-phosphate etherase [Elusimicrobiota bacterium]